jgi:hypothetical protein
MAGLALEEIVLVRSSANGPDIGVDARLNPAPGALKMSPVLELKCRKAIHGEVRRIEFRIDLNFAALYFNKLLLQVSALRCHCLGHAVGRFSQDFPNRHGASPTALNRFARLPIANTRLDSSLPNFRFLPSTDGT